MVAMEKIVELIANNDNEKITEMVANNDKGNGNRVPRNQNPPAAARSNLGRQMTLISCQSRSSLWGDRWIGRAR